MAESGTTQMLSMRMAAENPASIASPKPFTTDCTSIMPMDTMDCCRMDGTAIRSIFWKYRSSKRGALTSPQSFRSRRISTKKDKIAEIPCAITVAMATPATASSSTRTMKRSRPTFKREEKIRKYSGIRDLPSALKVALRTLYINKKGSPRK